MKENMSVSKYNKGGFTDAVLAFAAIILGSINSVYAGLPTAADVTSGSGVTTTNSPFAIIRELTTSTVGLAAIGFSSIVTLGVAWQMYAAFIESRRLGEWKGFAVTSLIGISLIIVVIVLSLLAVQYAAP